MFSADQWGQPCAKSMPWYAKSNPFVPFAFSDDLAIQVGDIVNLAARLMVAAGKVCR